MAEEQWTDRGHRTLQYAATSTPVDDAVNRVLLIVHGNETPIDVRLPEGIDGATRFVSLWSSADERPTASQSQHAPGEVLPVPGTSMRLFRVE